MAVNTWQFTHIGMLPEFPLTLIFHLVDIVVRNPIRVVVKDRSAQIGVLEFVINSLRYEAT